MQLLEWWPDYGGALLWVRAGPGGTQADLSELGLSSELVDELIAWGSKYGDDRLPIDGPGDSAWIDRGIQLLAEVRRQLAGRYDVVVTEPWWGEPAADY